MTEYRKQIYDRVKHGHQLGGTDRSAICMLFEDIDNLSSENQNLKAKIQYLEYQLAKYKKYDGFLASHGCFETNAIETPSVVTTSSTGEITIMYKKENE